MTNELLSPTEKATRLLDRAPNAAELAVLRGANKGEKIDLFDAQGRRSTVSALLIRDIFLSSEIYKLHDSFLEIVGAKFEDELDFENCTLHHQLILDQCEFEELVTLKYASTRNLSFDSSIFHDILDCTQAKIDGNLLLRRCESKKGIRVISTHIAGLLDLSGSTLWHNNRDKVAVFGDSSIIENDLDISGGRSLASTNDEQGFRRFESEGEIRFLNAEIKGDVYCFNARIRSPNYAALSFHGATIHGKVLLFEENRETHENRGGEKILDCTGAVDFSAACVEGRFDGQKVKIIGQKDNARQKNDGREDCFTALDFSDAICHMTLNLSKADVMHDIRMIGTTVKGVLYLKTLRSERCTFDLRHADIGTLVDNEATWNNIQRNFLNDFKYRNFAANSPTDPEFRIAWIKKERTWNSDNNGWEPQFLPQPYEQLAKVLHQMGHRSEARKVLIAREDAFYQQKGLSWGRRLWGGVIGPTARYGYEPWRASRWLGAFWIIGFLTFSWAHEGIYRNGFPPLLEGLNMMKPSKERVLMKADADKNAFYTPFDYPRFEPMIYSLDLLLPFVDLHVENYWEPNKKRASGWRGKIIRIYMWFHIAMGWFFSLIAVAGFSGLLKRGEDK